MPTFTGQVQNNQIILVAAISISDDPSPSRRPYQTLLDTGAQGTLISEKVAREVGLTPIGDSTITPVSGQPILTNKSEEPYLLGTDPEEGRRLQAQHRLGKERPPSRQRNRVTRHRAIPLQDRPDKRGSWDLQPQ